VPHDTVAITVNVVVDAGGRDRLTNCAALGVKLAVPEAPGAMEAPVIMKPVGAEICTAPSC
jgi:hypothetical protein